MSDIDVKADGVLCEKAVELLDAFIQECGLPVRTAQISGLKQIAFNQPSSLKEFAQHQRQRAERRHHDEEKAFWNLIDNLCDGRKPKHAWSLHQEIEGMLSEQEKADKKHLAALREEKKKLCYPPFFQHFCAHYLYRLSMKENP